MHCTQYNYKQDFQDSLKSVYMFVKHAHVYIILFLQCYGGGSPPAYPLLVMVVIVTGCRDAQQSFKTTSGGSGGGGDSSERGRETERFLFKISFLLSMATFPFVWLGKFTSQKSA